VASQHQGSQTRRSGDAAPAASAAGRFLRRLADFLDNVAFAARFRATLREINFLTLLISSAGILVIGSAIHGSSALPWLLLFAMLFNAGLYLIFQSSTWPQTRRLFFYALIALSAIPAAAERLLPMCLVVLVTCYLGLRLFREWELPHSYLNVLLALIYCYTSYGVFAATLEWRRNSLIAPTDRVAVDCGWQVERALVCSSQSTAFDVPEFWHFTSASHLIADLAGIMDFKVFADSATDNRIAFAVFSSPPASVMRSLTDFFNVQQKYLRSKAMGSKSLVPQGIMKSRDAELYALSYRSPEIPGYLGTYVERNALLLLHQPQLEQSAARDTTWFFVIDGTNLEAREFLLHRIITGFRRAP
jgi:hypothetical protein